MYQSLDLFQTADALARHAGQNTAAIARNVANADTPGYRARATTAFADAYRDDTGPALRLTRRGHLAGSAGLTAGLPPPSTAEASPNGNTVSIEEQMLQAVQAEREHDRALAIYRHTMGVIRTSLGR